MAVSAVGVVEWGTVRPHRVKTRALVLGWLACCRRKTDEGLHVGVAEETLNCMHVCMRWRYDNIESGLARGLVGQRCGSHADAIAHRIDF